MAALGDIGLGAVAIVVALTLLAQTEGALAGTAASVAEALVGMDGAAALQTALVPLMSLGLLMS